MNGDGFDDVIVGAPYYNNGGSYATGAAFLHLGGRQVIGSGPADATLHGQLSTPGLEDGFTYLGYDVAGAGDVNGDGYDDAIVGGQGTYSYSPEALIFHGASSGIPTSGPSGAASRLRLAGDSFDGVSVASAGDVNNDGHVDVMMAGIVDNQVELAVSGVFLGTASGVPSSTPYAPAALGELIVLESDWPWRAAVAAAGDVNGDGYDDVIVGMTTLYSTVGDPGVVRVYHGGPAPASP